MVVFDLVTFNKTDISSEIINLEREILIFKDHLINTTTFYKYLINENFNTFLPYLIGSTGVLLLIICIFPFFIPSLTCCALRSINNIICKFLYCIICKKRKCKNFNKLDIVEVDNDKSQSLIGV